MAKYNTFVVCNSKSGRIILVTSSARKAKGEMMVGRRTEVWNDNVVNHKITWKKMRDFSQFLQAERDWIASKQMSIEVRNRTRKIARM